MTKYVKINEKLRICKIKYSSFDCKLLGTNLSFAEMNLSCHMKNIYLHINPSPSNQYSVRTHTYYKQETVW